MTVQLPPNGVVVQSSADVIEWSFRDQLVPQIETSVRLQLRLANPDDPDEQEDCVLLLGIGESLILVENLQRAIDNYNERSI